MVATIMKTLGYTLLIIAVAAGSGCAKSKNKDMITVTDYLKADGKTDVADTIQKIIDANPNRTIYFPDGTYLISKPICTPAEPSKSVSLKLADYAVIKASENWDSDEAMIRLGGKDPFNNITTNGSNYSLTGGIIDGNLPNESTKSVTGVSIDSGRETAVRNVSIKHVKVGIHIKYGANNGSSDADISHVNIVGTAAEDSVGVIIEGFDNTLTDMRIGHVYTGVHIKSSGNSLKNIHPLFVGPDTKYNEKSCGFLIDMPDNWLIYCYSDQFAVGFRFTSSLASSCTMESCFTFWYSNLDFMEHVAVQAMEKFNTVVSGMTMGFVGDHTVLKTKNTLLKVGEKGGCGVMQRVRAPEEALNNPAEEKYKEYITDKLLFRE
ncbi:MAG: hypothetical protein J6U98_04935 [Abditibacteriota bacterium]|nr:hypothetical protein [Abditibacteriota bacterium]